MSALLTFVELILLSIFRVISSTREYAQASARFHAQRSKLLRGGHLSLELAAGSGSITAIASMSGLHPHPGYGAYSPAKAALIMLCLNWVSPSDGHAGFWGSIDRRSARSPEHPMTRRH